MKAEQPNLPYRKPWVLIDRVLCVEKGKCITAVKRISSSDFYLQGHFPSYSVYPGMLLAEGVKQAAEVLLTRSGCTELAGRGFVQEIQSRFLHPVEPGDTVTFDVCLTERDGETWVHGEGRTDESIVIKAQIKLTGEAHDALRGIDRNS